MMRRARNQSLFTLLALALCACDADDAQNPPDAAPDVVIVDFEFDSTAVDEGPSDVAQPDASDATVDSEIDAAPDAAPVDPTACNGHRHLCDRPFDEVAFAMTHNAHAYRSEFSHLAANQHLDIEAQLALGVRGLGIKLYRTDDENCGPDGIYGYHGFTSLGCLTFATIAAPIRAFLETHPRDVLAVTVEGGASADDLAQAFADEGLSQWLHTQSREEPWPTLEQLIEADARLVTFSADEAAENVPGFQHLWTRVQDTDYRAQRPDDLRCGRFRGPAEARLFLFNHFITILAPQPVAAEDINRAEFLGPRIADCAAERGLPNFVYVDFVELGGVLEVVDIVNGPGSVDERIATLLALSE